MKLSKLIWFFLLPALAGGQSFPEVDSIINANLGRYNNNVVVWVKQNDQPLYYNTWGTYDSTTSQFIASCTKWLSGAAILALADSGLISLDDSIGKHLPVFNTYGKGAPTIRQCMSHTSGFPGESGEGYESDASLTLAQSVDSIARNVDFLYAPGEKFYYGSISMHICGRIAEVVAGKGWAQVFDAFIADKCKMNNTTYFPLSNPLIAGGGYSTPEDYQHFLQMILNRGTFNGQQVLSEAAVEALYNDQTNKAGVLYSPVPNNPFISADTLRYGVGTWQDVPGEQISSPGLFGSYPWVDTCRRLTGMIFTYTQLDTVFVPNIEVIEEFRALDCYVDSVSGGNDTTGLKERVVEDVRVISNRGSGKTTITITRNRKSPEIHREIAIFNSLGEMIDHEVVENSRYKAVLTLDAAPGLYVLRTPGFVRRLVIY